MWFEWHVHPHGGRGREGGALHTLSCYELLLHYTWRGTCIYMYMSCPVLASHSFTRATLQVGKVWLLMLVLIWNLLNLAHTAMLGFRCLQSYMYMYMFSRPLRGLDDSWYNLLCTHIKLGNDDVGIILLVTTYIHTYTSVTDQVCRQRWSTSSHASPVSILLPILSFNLWELSLREPPGRGIGSHDGRRAGEGIKRAGEGGDP